MNEQAAHLVDRVLPATVGYRHWVLTLPSDLRCLVAYDRSLSGAVFAIVADVLQDFHRQGAHRDGIEEPHSGCILEIQRFSDAAGLRAPSEYLALPSP